MYSVKSIKNAKLKLINDHHEVYIGVAKQVQNKSQFV